jgi:predicted RNase H-like nuclease (RuvC/YqgF family)
VRPEQIGQTQRTVTGAASARRLSRFIEPHGRRDVVVIGAIRTTDGMDHQQRRLLNEIGANVEKIAADVEKLEEMPLNYALRRGIQEMIRKLDALAASYEGEAKKAREIAERLREIDTRSPVW